MIAAERMARIAAYTRQHGGGTFAAATGEPVEPVKGYAVGMAPGSAAIVAADASAETIAIAAHAVATEWSARFVGTWVMPDGRIAIDPVRLLTSRLDALRVGREHAQLAVYDFAAAMAIELTY